MLENPWGCKEENLRWCHNTHPQSLEDSKRTTKDWRLTNCHLKTTRQVIWSTPEKFEERGNSIWQHISSQVIGQPRLAGYRIITARRHQDTGRFKDTGERGNLSPPPFLHLPKIIYVLFPTWLFCVYSVIFIYMYYLCSLLSAGISTE